MILISSILIFSYAIFLGQAACENSCSYNGVCSNNECSCNQNYTGSDCSNKVLLLEKGVPLTTNESGTYFVYHIFTDTHPTPEHLYFKYNKEGSCTVQVLIYLNYFTIKYQEINYVSAQRNISFYLPSEVQSINHVLIIQVLSTQNSDLTITYGNLEEDQTTSTSILIIAISIPVGLIILIAIIFACCYRRIKRMCQQKYPRKITRPIMKYNSVYLEQNYIAPQQRIIQQPKQREINLNDECSSCLKPLQNGTPVVITPCRHKFHRDCIFQALMRQQSCPYCRFEIQANQLKGVNQVQIELT